MATFECKDNSLSSFIAMTLFCKRTGKLTYGRDHLFENCRDSCEYFLLGCTISIICQQLTSDPNYHYSDIILFPLFSGNEIFESLFKEKAFCDSDFHVLIQTWCTFYVSDKSKNFGKLDINHQIGVLSAISDIIEMDVLFVRNCDVLPSCCINWYDIYYNEIFHGSTIDGMDDCAMLSACADLAASVVQFYAEISSEICIKIFEQFMSLLQCTFIQVDITPLSISLSHQIRIMQRSMLTCIQHCIYQNVFLCPNLSVLSKFQFDLYSFELVSDIVSRIVNSSMCFSQVLLMNLQIVGDSSCHSRRLPLDSLEIPVIITSLVDLANELQAFEIVFLPTFRPSQCCCQLSILVEGLLWSAVTNKIDVAIDLSKFLSFISTVWDRLSISMDDRVPFVETILLSLSRLSKAFFRLVGFAEEQLISPFITYIGKLFRHCQGERHYLLELCNSRTSGKDLSSFLSTSSMIYLTFSEDSLESMFISQLLRDVTTDILVKFASHCTYWMQLNFFHISNQESNSVSEFILKIISRLIRLVESVKKKNHVLESQSFLGIFIGCFEILYATLFRAMFSKDLIKTCNWLSPLLKQIAGDETSFSIDAQTSPLILFQYVEEWKSEHLSSSRSRKLVSLLLSLVGTLCFSFSGQISEVILNCRDPDGKLLPQRLRLCTYVESFLLFVQKYPGILELDSSKFLEFSLTLQNCCSHISEQITATANHFHSSKRVSHLLSLQAFKTIKEYPFDPEQATHRPFEEFIAIVFSCCSVIRSSAFYCSEESIRLLLKLLLAWSKIEICGNSRHTSVLFSEIIHLRNSGTFTHLIRSNLLCFVKVLVIPLIQHAHTTIVSAFFKEISYAFQREIRIQLYLQILSELSVNESSMEKHLLVSQIRGLCSANRQSTNEACCILYTLLSCEGHIETYDDLERCFSSQVSSLGLGININSRENSDKLVSWSLTVLLWLIWDLGTPSRKAAALQGLKIISLSPHNEENYPEDMSDESKVSLLVSQYFLFFIRKIVQNNWSNLTQNQQVHCIRTLCEVVELLPKTHLIKFLPKFMTILDNSISSACGQVQYCTVLLVDRLCQCLPPSALASNLFPLIVLLFPLLQVDVNIPDASRLKAIYSVQQIFSLELGDSSSIRISFECQDTSSILDGILSVSHIHRVEQSWRSIAKSTTINFLREVLQQPVQCDILINNLAFFPKVPELDDVCKPYFQGMGNVKVHTQIAFIKSMLQHDSTQVRLVALKRLAAILKSSRHEIVNALCSLSDSTQLLSKGFVLSLLSDLIQVCSRDLNEELLLHSGICLGEIGAIDPAMMNTSSRTTKQKYSEIPSWHYTVEGFGLLLLESHLVPSLKAADQGQDRSGFAIQSVLQKLIDIFRGEDGIQPQSIPRKLKSKLAQRMILDIVEPFLSTRYQMKDVVPLKSSPIFESNLPFLRWIGMWVRYLISHTTGLFHDYYAACKGAIRNLGSLCQFLLPHLICDVVTNEANSTQQMLIVQEICVVLEKSCLSESESSMPLQVVFELLDTLTLWTSRAYSKGCDSMMSEEKIVRVQSSLKQIITEIPKKLLGLAAFRIKAYARAVRYFEQFSREINSKSAATSLQVGFSRNDGANGTLPILNSFDIDKLSVILSRIDLPDALHGIQTVGKIYGYSTSIRSRILECEEAGDWMGALMEYNIIHHSKDRHLRIHDCTSNEENLDFFSAEQVNCEKGRLKCLIELGHLDAAIDQALGTIERFPRKAKSLSVTGVEASWKLMNWEMLGKFLEPVDAERDADLKEIDIISDSDELFNVRLGQLLLSLHHANIGKFEADLRSSRLEVEDILMSATTFTYHLINQVMKSLATAGKESYERSYPFLVQLQILQEFQDGLGARFDSPESQFQSWEQKKELMSPSPRYRSIVMSVRRSILGTLGLNTMVAQNWLSVSKDNRKMGSFDTAKFALRNAELWGLGSEASSIVTVNESLILAESGNLKKALLLIEPVELNIANFRSLDSSQQAMYSSQQFAKRFHLATQLMVKSKQKVGRAITDRYEYLFSIQEDNELAYYEFGRYLESLYQDSKSKEVVEISSEAGLKPKLSKDISSAISESLKKPDELPSIKFVKSAIGSYGKSLKCGDTFTMQSMSRMLTLWFTFTSTKDPTEAGNSKAQVSKSSALHVAQRFINQEIEKLVESISASKWYSCLPQLVSRLGHSNPGTIQNILTIIEKVLIAFPFESIWHVACLLKSSSLDRLNNGKRIIERASISLKRMKAARATSMISQSSQLFNDLVGLAEYLPNTGEKKIRYPLGKDLDLSLFLVPVQGFLIHTSINSNLSLLNKGDLSYSGSGKLFIQDFLEDIDVASSKARPKTLTLLTTSGTKIKFLSKREKDGDLRKDARMMDFNAVVNRLLSDDMEGRRRGLHIRTYAVVCLNEECGILEWVNDTKCIRHLITDAYTCWDDGQYSLPNLKEIFRDFPEIQKKVRTKLDTAVLDYRQMVTNRYKPCFHRWFLLNFDDSMQWLEARTKFTRSAAVWSIVGHIVGLGDRHTENILLDVLSGECVHVDFDCLFDKGLTLDKPEIVPFRLTPNMVDAMGLTGVEGVFRRTMEVCLTLLKENRDTLLSVLEPFLRDPTVAWRGRGGRAQRRDTGSTGKSILVGQVEQENTSASDMLNTIAHRLNGLYNIYHPQSELIADGNYRYSGVKLSRGIGALSKEELPLSVEGQVQRLIDEAISEENLVQMFIGWMPWC